MRKFNHLLVFIIVLGLVLTSVHIIWAQQQQGAGQRRAGQQRQGRQQGQGRQMDPAAIMERMMERVMEQLNLSAEESAVLKPMIEGVMQTRMQQGQEMRERMTGLREAMNADTKDSGKIGSSLQAIKDKRKEHRKKSEELEKNLTDLLTLEQEAALTISGIVNSDSGGGMAFGRFGGQGQRGQRNRPGGGQQGQ